MDGEQLRVVVIAEVESAVFTQFEACIFHGGTQFYAADIGVGNQVNGDGLVNTRTELVEGLRNFCERIQVGMQNFAVHQLGKSINLLVEVLQLFTRGQTVAADSLKAHNEALVVNSRNRLGNAEMVVYGATDDLEAVGAGKARQGVQFLGLFQGDVGHVVEARIKPRQLDLR